MLERLFSLAVRWLILSGAVWVAADLLPGIHLQGWQSTLAVAAILGLLNLWLRPALVLLSLPITILSVGLFLVVINAFLLELTNWIASWFHSIHFRVDNFGDALLGALVISLVGHIVSAIVRPEEVANGLVGDERLP